jgi:cysteine desulfurase
VLNKSHIIVSAIEHASVLQPAKELEKRGEVALTVLPVDKDGVVDLKVLKESLRPETILVSIMFANNEIGTIQPIKEIAKILRDFRRERGLNKDHANYPYFHTDACQATRFFDLDTRKLGVDLMTINANKMYGPKGGGALYVRRGVKVAPLLYGGGQEGTLRSGTENVSGIVGLAKAFVLATKFRDKETKNLNKLRDYAIKKIQKEIPGTILNGSATNRLPNNLNFTFPGVDAEWLVLQLDAKGISCSTGSACSFNTKDESYVIMALGKTEADAKSSVRFSLGRETTKSDLDILIKYLKLFTKT